MFFYFSFWTGVRDVCHIHCFEKHKPCEDEALDDNLFKGSCVEDAAQKFRLIDLHHDDNENKFRVTCICNFDEK